MLLEIQKNMDAYQSRAQQRALLRKKLNKQRLKLTNDFEALIHVNAEKKQQYSYDWYQLKSPISVLEEIPNIEGFINAILGFSNLACGPEEIRDALITFIKVLPWRIETSILPKNAKRLVEALQNLTFSHEQTHDNIKEIFKNFFGKYFKDLALEKGPSISRDEDTHAIYFALNYAIYSIFDIDIKNFPFNEFIIACTKVLDAWISPYRNASVDSQEMLTTFINKFRDKQKEEQVQEQEQVQEHTSPAI